MKNAVKKNEASTTIFQRLISHRFSAIGLILVFAFLVRLPQPLLKLTPFGFDHGRDAVAVLHLVKTLKPVFIGPWTSIPGLYFGPGWYYLLAPIYFISGGYPVAPVFLMIGMILLQVFLAYKYFGKVEALLIACCPIWMFISASAWNPFPMTLLSLLLLILLKNIQHKQLSEKRSFLLGFISALGFHFSTAFAIFYPVIILLAVVLARVKLRVKSVVAGIVGFILPFIPQIIFEVRHEFLQSKAVLRYLTGSRSQEDAFTLEKVKNVLSVTFGELKLAVLPGIWLNNSTLEKSIAYIGLAILVVGAFFIIKKKKKVLMLNESALFFIIPTLGLFFLHFNLWYILAMIPAAVIFCAQLLRAAPKYFKYVYIVLIILTPISLVARVWSEKEMLSDNNQLLPAQLRAIAEVKKRADGQPFSSYQYVSDIYDYSYQYIYLWQAFQGDALPVEFSYQPGEKNYILEKEGLLKKLPAPATKPVKIFFIVQKTDNKEYLDSWWSRQRYNQIIDEVLISDTLILYEATPLP